jgi:hypothetical protein
MEGISEVPGKRKKARPPRGAARRSVHSPVHSHPFEVRRKAVQLCLEEGFPWDWSPVKWFRQQTRTSLRAPVRIMGAGRT